MKSLFRDFLGIFLSLNASAWGRNSYPYQGTFERIGEAYINRLEDTKTDSLSELSPDKRDKCEQRYNGILKDGVLDIRVALGYFDWITGPGVRSLDLGAYASLKIFFFSL